MKHQTDKGKAIEQPAGPRPTGPAQGRRRPAVILDDQLPEAFAELRRATPSKRLTVYGVWDSIPCIDPEAARRRWERGER